MFYGVYGRNIENGRFLCVLYLFFFDFNFFKYCILGVVIYFIKSFCFFRGFGIKISFVF